MSLVKRNAVVGADIANSISDLLTKDAVQSQRPQVSQPPSRVVCVGGSVIDTIGKSSPSFLVGTSNPGVIHSSGKMPSIYALSFDDYNSPVESFCVDRWRRRSKYSRGSRTAWIETLFLHGHRGQV